jgi:hypothetical protein
MSPSRRYIVRNHLVYMWVLTFADGLHGPEGYEECKRLVAQFVREQLRPALGGEAFPYWYAPEPHPAKKGSKETCDRDDCPCEGHGWHVNLFINRKPKHEVVKRLWGHGHVWVSDWSKQTRGFKSSRRDCARRAASYGTKYATKDFGAGFGEHYSGLHRYERSQQHNPARSVSQHNEWRDAYGAAVQEFGGEVPAFTLRSDELAEYSGAPFWWMQWDT